MKPVLIHWVIKSVLPCIAGQRGSAIVQHAGKDNVTAEPDLWAWRRTLSQVRSFSEVFGHNHFAVSVSSFQGSYLKT